MKTALDEITVVTEHPLPDEWSGRGRVIGARMKPDLMWLRREAGRSMGERWSLM